MIGLCYTPLSLAPAEEKEFDAFNRQIVPGGWIYGTRLEQLGAFA